MPTSAAGNNGAAFAERPAEFGFTPVRRSAEHGFTLVELIVVVTVIALASAIAVLAVPADRSVHEEAARFAVRARAVRDLAIVGGRPTALWVTGAGYGFDQRVGGRWLPLADKPLRVERWDDRTRVDTGATGPLRVAFDTTGMADRTAEWRLSRGDEAVTVQLAADGSAVAR